MNLEDEFYMDMRYIVKKAKKANYNPQIFIQMLDLHKGVDTAKRLLASKEPQTGLDRLWYLKMLDDSMEAYVIKEKYKSLFTDQEIAEARKRLADRDYHFPNGM